MDGRTTCAKTMIPTGRDCATLGWPSGSIGLISQNYLCTFVMTIVKLKKV